MSKEYEALNYEQKSDLNMLAGVKSELIFMHRGGEALGGGVEGEGAGGESKAKHYGLPTLLSFLFLKRGAQIVIRRRKLILKKCKQTYYKKAQT